MKNFLVPAILIDWPKNAVSILSSIKLKILNFAKPIVVLAILLIAGIAFLPSSTFAQKQVSGVKKLSHKKSKRSKLLKVILNVKKDVKKMEEGDNGPLERLG